MAKIPEFILKALYVKNSLHNTADGFEFQLKNELGPARIIGATPLKLDRGAIPAAECSFIHGGQEQPFEAVTAESSVLMRKGEAVTVRVRGTTLKPGRRSLDVGVVIKDVGQVGFNIADQVK